MKIFKICLTFGLLVTSTISVNANDYALFSNYPLLNDMKMAKKEQLLLDDMHALISDRKQNNKKRLLEQKKIFSTIISGLLEGDKSLGLHGTELHSLKTKIATIQLLWSHENTILDSALHNKMYMDDAYATLEKLSSNLKELNSLYAQSYARYKKHAIIKTLVSSYMQKNNELLAEPMYAMK